MGALNGALLISVGAVAQLQQDSDAEACIIGSGDVVIDVAVCSRAIASADLPDHTLSALYSARGRATMYQGYADEALADLEIATELNPSSAIAFHHRGLVYDVRGDYLAALADYNQALRINPFFSTVHRDRARAYFFLSRDEDAETEFNKATDANPFDPEGFAFRGFLRFRHGEFRAAAADFAKVAALSYPYQYNPLWRYLAQTRSNQNGRADLSRAAESHKAGEWPLLLIDTYLGRLSPAAAIQQISLGVADDATRQQQVAESHFYLGQLLLTQGQNDRASTLLRVAAATAKPGSIEQFMARQVLNRSP